MAGRNSPPISAKSQKLEITPCRTGPSSNVIEPCLLARLAWSSSSLALGRPTSRPRDPRAGTGALSSFTGQGIERPHGKALLASIPKPLLSAGVGVVTAQAWSRRRSGPCGCGRRADEAYRCAGRDGAARLPAVAGPGPIAIAIAAAVARPIDIGVDVSVDVSVHIAVSSSIPS
jgi:hypothetical protein